MNLSIKKKSSQAIISFYMKRINDLFTSTIKKNLFNYLYVTHIEYIKIKTLVNEYDL